MGPLAFCGSQVYDRRLPDHAQWERRVGFVAQENTGAAYRDRREKQQDREEDESGRGLIKDVAITVQNFSTPGNVPTKFFDRADHSLASHFLPPISVDPEQFAFKYPFADDLGQVAITGTLYNKTFFVHVENFFVARRRSLFG